MKDIRQLKEAAERATNARVRAKVELEHAEARLKELGYDSVDEAKADIETEMTKLENDFPELAD